MLRYARSDVHGYTPPGAACPGHTESADPDDAHFSVDCAACDPFLAKDPLWASDPDETPLTRAETKRREKAEQDNQVVLAQLAQAVATAGVRQISEENAAVKPAAPRKAAARPRGRKTTSSK